jgi:hypothetical protein
VWLVRRLCKSRQKGTVELLRFFFFGLNPLRHTHLHNQGAPAFFWVPTSNLARITPGPRAVHSAGGLSDPAWIPLESVAGIGLSSLPDLSERVFPEDLATPEELHEDIFFAGSPLPSAVVSCPPINSAWLGWCVYRECMASVL